MKWYPNKANTKSIIVSVFYICFEGHYAPQLAELIHKRNKNCTKDLIVNLKGLLVTSLSFKNINC